MQFELLKIIILNSHVDGRQSKSVLDRITYGFAGVMYSCFASIIEVSAREPDFMLDCFCLIAFRLDCRTRLLPLAEREQSNVSSMQSTPGKQISI